MTSFFDLISNIVNADSYKVSHWSQYPKGTTYVSSYIEARNSTYAKAFGKEYDYAVSFGLQAYLRDYLSTPITQDDIDLAEVLYRMHGEPFHKEGWEYILKAHGGKLPVEIRAVPEGTVMPTGNSMVQIVNTDPECYWLTSYVETSMLRSLWYPTTVATKSRIAKDFIGQYLDETSDNPAVIEHMFDTGIFTNPANLALHDFGARGASSMESASLGDMSHLLNFRGTDTVTGILAAIYFYEPGFSDFLKETPDNPKKAMTKFLLKMEAEGRVLHGVSVEASEHSTMTIMGREGEAGQIKMMIDKAKQGKIVSIVSDSYNLWNAVDNLYGDQFKGDIIEAGKAGGRVVVRPDSGKPTEVVVEVLKRLEAKFGSTTNSKGYKVLPPYLRVLQGDGIDLGGAKGSNTLRDVLDAVKQAGFSVENIVMGMGGGLLQKVNRDDLSFAQKASFAVINGEEFEVYKDPITSETGFKKKSKRGVLATIWDGCAFQTVQAKTLAADQADSMQVVFRNGDITKTTAYEHAQKFVNYFRKRLHNDNKGVSQPSVDNPWKQALEAA